MTGFCRNVLILKVRVKCHCFSTQLRVRTLGNIYILQGPLAARSIKNNEKTDYYERNTKPRATAWGLYRITSACIAAGAVLVLSTLSR